MKIYIAGAYADRDFLRQKAKVLVKQGHEVTSSWLTVIDKATNNPKTAAEYRLGGTISQRDLDDVARADVFIMDTFTVNLSAGRNVEWGYAYAMGKELIRIGPVRTVFHCLKSALWAPTWDQIIAIGGHDAWVKLLTAKTLAVRGKITLSAKLAGGGAKQRRTRFSA